MTALSVNSSASLNLKTVRRWIVAVGQPILQAFIVSALVIVITFFLIRLLLGDPAVAMLGGNTGASPERVAALREELGLNQPLWTQFTNYVAALLQGDLGNSFQHPATTVTEIIASGAGVTLALILLTLVISSVVGVTFGLLTAGKNSPILNRVVQVVSLIGLSAPGALVGLLLILIVALGTGWFPAGGWGSGYPENFHYLILPAIAVSFWLAPIILRAVRDSASEVLNEPFAEAALARGMSRNRLMLRHVLPNAAGPVLTVIAVNLSYLVSGAVIVEIVFGLPGIGRAMTTAVGASDFPVIQGLVMVTGAAVVVLNLAVELITKIIDPRSTR